MHWLSALNHADLKKMVTTVPPCWMCSSSANKVLPAMYLEEETELAFDDIMPEDPDFSAIQGIGHLKCYYIHPFSNCRL